MSVLSSTPNLAPGQAALTYDQFSRQIMHRASKIARAGIRNVTLVPCGARRTDLIMQLASPGTPKRFLRFWVAPLFAAALSAITIGTFLMVRPHSYEAGFSAFFCFLPSAFFFSSTAQIESQKQIRTLQQRIEQLEAQAAQPSA